MQNLMILSDKGMPAAYPLPGDNRQLGNPCQIEAETDIDAVQDWLSQFHESPNTFRAYRKEIERFVNWALSMCGKPISGLKRGDFDSYQVFMAAPPKDWCSNRSVKRSDPSWRPFEGALSNRSQAQAMTVISALFDYLVAVNYLIANPMRANRGRRRGIIKGASKIDRSVSEDTIRRILAALERLVEVEASASIKNSAIRNLFLVRFLVNTGLRREELAVARMRDLFTIETTKGRGVFLDVVGKGNKRRHVVINEAAIEALSVYRQHYGLHTLMLQDDDCPILLSVAGNNAISKKTLVDGVVYATTRKAIATAAAVIAETSPEIAASLQKISPHWFRHAYASACLNNGYSINAVQDQLGHASITTTATYQHQEDISRYQELSGLSL